MEVGGHIFFAAQTALFFAAPPWNERYICPVCKSPEDFSGEGVYLDSDPCDDCGTTLVPCWSEERFVRFLKKYSGENLELDGFLATSHNEAVGWILGHGLKPEELEEIDAKPGERVYCIDLLGTVAGVRRRRSIWRRMREILFVGKVRFSPIHFSPIDILIKLTGLPAVGVLYLKLLRRAYRQGYRSIITKTHIEATSVRQLLELAGFREIKRDYEDLRLSIWRKDLEPL